jgi:hypothetical protein
VDPGFRSNGVVVAGLNFRRLDLPEDRRHSFTRDLLDRMRALPGIDSAATVDIVPLSGNAAGNDMWPEGNPSQRFNVLYSRVGSGYFGVLRIPLVAGRDFDARDTTSSEPVIIVNEAFAAKLPQGTRAVGSRVTREATPRRPEVAYRIIGVVRNSKYLDLKEEPSPVAFTTEAQGPPAAYAQVVVRSTLPASAVTAAMTPLSPASTRASRSPTRFSPTRFRTRCFESGCWPRCRVASDCWQQF